jgi:homopolymeric O-antigen transport system permease protein
VATLSSQAHLSAASRPAVIIRATKGWALLDLRELWGYRELLYFLMVRDIKVRYNQTVIGVVWAVLQPLAMMATFTLLFGRLAKIPSDGLPYPLFAYAGLLAWQLFSRTLSESTNSLLVNQRLITRVYFPRIIVPISTTLAALVDFGISLVLFFALMLIYGVTPGWTVLWIPVFLALLLMTSLGVGFWLSSLSVEFRDVAHIMPFISQLWLFLTPVVYPSSLVPPAWRALYGLNPMAGVVEGFRWSLLGGGVGPSLLLGVSSLVAAALFISGIAWFRRRERSFVDAIGSR